MRLATRKSPLALTQAAMVAECLRQRLDLHFTLLPMISTGDRQTEWSLEDRGGKGLFTAELEASLLRGEADVAVHSAKDLPGTMPPGLALAGYLPRADARDVLIHRQGVANPRTIATGSPRRRAQLRHRFPDAAFCELRGNVDTRLKKIAAGQAEASVLAAAGLARLGIVNWPGLEFAPFAIDEVVPAVAQGAIAVQCRAGEECRFASALDGPTAVAVTVERAFQAALGAGCHTAVAVHLAGSELHFYHEQVGRRQWRLEAEDIARPEAVAAKLLAQVGLVEGR